MPDEPRSWTMRHFSLSNAAGPDQDDVPALLRRVAASIEEHGDIRVQDLILHTDITEHGYWPSITVYFSPEDDEE